ncbi:hypothetical protein [Psychrobacter sp. I-STPA10]|uniref:hypothetical protein n=1 Tax=Psychrobacter sp. I-STPA10 TaxID=2585769 RepID=UPI001E50753F|nr:hypothetical protein [Psychrobacter sp. I-STPA10]
MSSNKDTKITRQDLKFYPSERLTDNDDGGGMPLGTPISGEANELFNPISSIARVNGSFHARLVYMGVTRPDDEPLIGTFAAITKPPKDPTVSYLLFPATKFGEQRNEILKRIEAYSVGTIESRMTLLSTQSQNSKIIQAYQRPEEPLPLIGDVYCLRQDKAGYAQHEQYVQVVKVTSEERTFTQNNKDFTRTVVKLEISSKLEADFVGVDYPSESYVDTPCKIRETHVADAAQYYGIKPLTEAILRESTQIKIAGLMEKLVPTNQIETALIDLTAAGQRQTLFDGTKADSKLSLTINKSHSAGSNSTVSLGNAVLPNSITLNTSNGNITDKGGLLILNDNVVGKVDYTQGDLQINEPSFSGYLNNVSFKAAASELKVADTARIDVDINNRSYNDVMTIDPPPAVGSLIVSYRAQGRWYDLRDDGTGALRGASAAHGSGNVNYTTGTVNVSYGELPDIGSAVLFSWSTRARYFNRSDIATSAKMLLNISQDAVPSTLSLSWNDGEDKTATCDAAGNITGDWTGQYDPNLKQIRIDTDANFNHPDGVLDINVSYNVGNKATKIYQAPQAGSDGQITLEDLSDKPLKPHSVKVKWPLFVEGYIKVDGKNWIDPYQVITDDGAGLLVNNAGETVGTVDYAARTLKFNTDVIVNIPKPVYKTTTGQVRDGLIFDGTGYQSHMKTVITQVLTGYEYADATATLPEDGVVEVYFYDTDTANSVTEQLSSGDIEIDLLPHHAESIAPASINVTWAGHTYFDKLGSIYTDLDPKTGSAQLAGTVDYQAGKMLLTNWQWQNGNAPVINSLVTSIGSNPVDSVTFRVPSSPLRAGSLEIRAVAVNGTKINARANYAGELKADGIQGLVDTEFGVVDVKFGQLVNAFGNENEDWYDQEAIHNGKIWKPLHVLAETITYNAVAYSYLPIDSNVVKIDTVRLPQDGRIPIFRRGDTILIGNRQTDDIGSAHTGGQTVQLSRNDVDRICVSDANGQPVNAELWDYDLDAGTITWTTPLDLSSYQMPLSVMHAQEERNRIHEADIDGTLSLIFPTKRDYPIDSTYVSSVLIGDDLQVRVSVPFTQRNWDKVWRDEPVGDTLLNKLNLKDYPMVLTDDGAITERWMIKMTGTSQFELYGETLGFVMRGDTLTDLAPINPASNKPYFTIPKQAFGNEAPWASQDIIRFNTWGTLLPVWVLCAVQPSSSTPKGEDGYTMCLYGDTTETKEIL